MLLPLFLVLSLAAHSPESHAAGETRVYLDLAPADQFADLLAVPHAVRSADLKLLGVGTTRSNTAESARVLHKILRLMGREDIPVGKGDSAARANAPWLSWAEDSEFAPALSAPDLLLQIAAKSKEPFSVIASGPLTNIAAALQKDPEIASKIERIYLPDAILDGSPSPNLELDKAAAGVVFSSTIPITLFDHSICDALTLTRTRLQKIASGRSALSEALLIMHAQAAKALPQSIPFTTSACLAVSFANSPSITTASSRRLLYENGSIMPAEELSGRDFQVADQTHPSALMREIISRVEDANLEFSSAFTRFLLDLRSMQPESILKVQGFLKTAPPLPKPPEGSTSGEMFTFQAIAYVARYVEMLNQLDDPVAKKLLAQFKNTLLALAGIGWWHPDEFYERWAIEIPRGAPLKARFGIANPYHQQITQARGSLDVNGMNVSAAVNSTTDQIVFDLTLNRLAAVQLNSARATLAIEFTCLGSSYRLEKSTPVEYAPDSRIAGIRCATDTVSIAAIASQGISLAFPAMAADAQPIEARAQSGPSWTEIKVPRQDANQRMPFTITPASDALPVAGLLPCASDVLLVEPEGPSHTPSFAVERKGKWGWATDFLSGRECIEYRALPFEIPKAITDPILISIDFLCEADDADSFRIEAATESAVYHPVIPWIMKPEEHGWSRAQFRVSPIAESMIRSKTLRWLRVQSGKDGDEVVHSLHFH